MFDLERINFPFDFSSKIPSYWHIQDTCNQELDPKSFGIFNLNLNVIDAINSVT